MRKAPGRLPRSFILQSLLFGPLYEFRDPGKGLLI